MQLTPFDLRKKSFGNWQTYFSSPYPVFKLKQKEYPEALRWALKLEMKKAQLGSCHCGRTILCLCLAPILIESMPLRALRAYTYCDPSDNSVLLFLLYHNSKLCLYFSEKVTGAGQSAWAICNCRIS